MGYYSEKDNFISVTAEISHMDYYQEDDIWLIAFSNLPEVFPDVNFLIIDENWKIIKQNGGEDKLKIGEEITFVSALRYFGDGYLMPIVAVSIGDEILLEFEEGYENFVKTYE